MAIHLYRIDDRLIHGQVVVGWGQPLDIKFLVLVDDLVASSDWEKDLYRMAVPPEMEVIFSDVASAIRDHARWAADKRPGILIAGDITSMHRLVGGVKAIGSVNLGGVRKLLHAQSSDLGPHGSHQGRIVWHSGNILAGMVRC